MRQWEKTFPDQLWVEFGRLTNDRVRKRVTEFVARLRDLMAGRDDD